MTQILFIINILKNAVLKNKVCISLRNNKKVIELIKILSKESLIYKYILINNSILVYFKYYNNSPILNITSNSNIRKLRVKKGKLLNNNNLTIIIVNTNSGMKVLQDCEKNKLSGNVLCVIK